MSSLYNIRQEHLNLLALIEEQDGEVLEDQLQLLQLTEEDFQQKAISYAYIIKKFDDESDTIKAEIDRLSKLKKVADNKTLRFKKLLDEGMTQFKVEKIDTPTLKISYKKSKQLSISEELENLVKERFTVSVKILEDGNDSIDQIFDYLKCGDISIDKTKLKADISNDGVKIEGAEITENKNIQIR